MDSINNIKKKNYNLRLMFSPTFKNMHFYINVDVYVYMGYDVAVLYFI